MHQFTIENACHLTHVLYQDGAAPSLEHVAAMFAESGLACPICDMGEEELSAPGLVAFYVEQVLSPREEHEHDPILLSVRLMNNCTHGKLSRECCGYPEWLQVIHAVNGQREERFFGEPVAMYNWWAGGWCEEYPEFRVILRDDSETANVQAKTPEAKAALHAAVKEVCGFEVDDNGMRK